MIKKNIRLNLFLIFIFGTLIRLMSLDKTEGLWNDEYISWFISQQSLSGGFVNAVFKNCHVPFYYFFLKLWTFVFGNSDYILRLSSVLCGSLSILLMFFVGKELKNEKIGLSCSFFTAISGFLIYFSQEVRFYSLLFLFSAFSVWAILKLLKNQNCLNFLLFYFSNVLLLFTHTIGFVFVFFNFVFTFWVLKKENKILNHQILIIIFATILSSLPLFPFVFKTLTSSYSSQFWSDFSLLKVFFVLADYISPIQINIVNTPSDLLYFLEKNGSFNYGYFFFAIIPFCIACVLCIKGFINADKKLKLISYIAFSTFIVMLLAAACGKMVLVTKYTMEVYPAFLLLLVVGLHSIKINALKKVISFILIFLLLSYLLISDYAPQKLGRKEGHKQVADLISRANLKKNDKILLLYYEDYRFSKYCQMDNFFVESVTKFNFQYRLLNNPPLHSFIMQNGKEIFKQSFEMNENEFFNRYLNIFFFNNMKKGQKFALISLKSVAFVDDVHMKKIVSDNSKYEKIPLIFLIFSNIDNMTQKQANMHLKPFYKGSEGYWNITVWTKP
jgi:4-amino-4-deoxy-L-arabinose transferase-like glycosyltransferase